MFNLAARYTGDERGYIGIVIFQRQFITYKWEETNWGLKSSINWTHIIHKVKTGLK